MSDDTRRQPTNESRTATVQVCVHRMAMDQCPLCSRTKRLSPDERAERNRRLPQYPH